LLFPGTVQKIHLLSAANISTELPVTKRNVLRKAATVFDPLGFVGPFVIKAKILLQEL